MIALALAAVAALIVLSGGLTVVFGAGAIGFFLLIGIAAALKAGPVVALVAVVWLAARLVRL